MNACHSNIFLVISFPKDEWKNTLSAARNWGMQGVEPDRIKLGKSDLDFVLFTSPLVHM